MAEAAAAAAEFSFGPTAAALGQAPGWRSAAAEAASAAAAGRARNRRGGEAPPRNGGSWCGAFGFAAAAAASGEEFRTAPSLKELAGPQRLVTDAQNRTTVSHVIELMRIPKGASTHLSIAGRALAGCPHPGYPCCIKKHEGEYCPRENLYCALVKKCVGHGGLHEPDDPIPTITQFRDPAERLLSGFFYPEGTHNKHHKDCSTWECFEKYLADPRLRDAPATKMLLGRYPYSPDRIKPGEVEHAKLNLCKLAWFGMIVLRCAELLHGLLHTGRQNLARQRLHKVQDNLVLLLFGQQTSPRCWQRD